MFKTILVILKTLNNSNEALLQQVMMMAESSQAHVILAYNVPFEVSNHQQFSDPFAWRLQQTKAENALANICNQLVLRGIDSTPCILDSWDVNTLTEVIQRNNVDLIIIRKPQDSVDDLLNGLLKTTPIPVLAVPETISPIKNILVPLDGSSRAECALSTTSLLVQHLGCDVVLFHAVQAPHDIYQHNQNEDERDMLEFLVSSGVEKAKSYLQGVAKRLSFNSELEVVVSNKVCSSIHKIIDDKAIDLIVLSAHGEGGQPQWPYGSITYHMITYAHIPVLIIQDLPDTTVNRKTNLIVESLRQPRKRVAVN